MNSLAPAPLPAPVDSTLPAMDLFIAGMGRAGTTLLANLLTVPPSQWIITEPGITRGDMGEHVRQQAARFGLEISAAEWNDGAPGETALARFARVLAPRLDGVRWGVKEVNPAGYDDLLRLFRPRKMVLAVRDIRDCAFSLLEKHAKVARPNPAHTRDWMHGRLLDAARALVKLHRETPADRLRVVRYEDFVTDPARRVELAAWLGLELDGDPARCLDLYGREDEPLKHEGGIGAGSVNRGATERRPDWIAFADRLARDAADYQAAFGYAPPPPPASAARPPMRIIMGRRHREKIRGFLRPGARMLEWGAGGSTVWLASVLPEGATLTSVEHDPKWFEAVREHLAGDPRVRLILREATGPLGANATIGEEDAGPLQNFVHAVDGERFDVILVDGNARHACLEQARSLLAPDGVVLLHDAQRAWYDDAKTLFRARGHIGSCPDYPSPHLWWGGHADPGAPVRATGELPLVISFYTRGTDYEIEARRLIASCEKLGLDHHIVGLESRGSWEANCSLKSEFVLSAWENTGRPVLWVDADAVLHAAPELLRGATADFAIHRCRDWQFASGTVFFNQTPGAAALLARWIARCRSHPRVWDQDNLDLAWEEVVATRPLETLWLPEPYCRIFDLHEGRSRAPGVIEHFQASRRLKTKVSAVPPAPPVTPGPALVAARRATRPRAWLLSAVDGVTRAEHAAHPGRPAHHPGLLAELADLFTAGHPAPARVLTVADGIGVLWRLLSERGHEVHALSNDAAYVADAELFAPGRVRLGGADALPHPDRGFDAVVAFGLLEALPEEKLDAALAELGRVARDEVFLIIRTTPDPEPRWPASDRPRAWWTTRIAAAGFRLLPASATATHADYLRQPEGCIVLRARPPVGHAAPALTAEPETARPVPADLGAFAGQLGRFLGAGDLLQIDWEGDAVNLLRLTPGGEQAFARRVLAGGFYPRLPLPDAAADAVFNLGGIARLDDLALPGWLAELERVTARFLWLGVEAAPGRDRAWWENRLIEAGFRKHPLAQCVTGYEELEDEAGGLLLLFEKIPAAARLAHPLSVLRAERDLHMDMLREGGVRSDAHLARYVLAREHVRPGMVVLDAACGLGYGSAALARGTGAARVIGVDNSERAVRYARDVYGEGESTLEFHCQDATRLDQLADASVDLVVSFETLEHLPNPDRLLREFARVLRPGGLFVGSVPNLWINEHGHNPVPYHLHIYDHAQFHDQIARHFAWIDLYRENAGGGWKRPQPRILRAIPDCAPTPEDERDAEWWIAVAGKAA